MFYIFVQAVVTLVASMLLETFKHWLNDRKQTMKKRKKRHKN